MAVEKPRRSLFRRFWLPAVLLLGLTAGGLTGMVAAYALNTSKAAKEVAALANYRPSSVTRVYADDGKTVIGEFALERRIPVKYEDIPPVMRNAILAVEDTRFYNHIGIDPVRIIGVAYKDLVHGSREGGSTLTQQLAKNLFLTREQTLKRKLNEWAMALQIERYYTKNQIMEMYANTIFLGARSYGIEAASQTYFGKHAKDLTLEEAALLAGIPRSTSQYSPTTHPQAAKERRDLVLDLMARSGYISQAEADAAKAKPIKLIDSAYYPPPASPYSYLEYPVEEIRKQIEDKYTTRVAFSGLQVYSTINVAAQKKAQEAVQAGLRRYDKTHSRWRSDYQNIAGTDDKGNKLQPSPQQLNSYVYPGWYGDNMEPGAYLMGLVMSVDRARNEAKVRFGRFTATVTAKDMGRAARPPASEFAPGDLAEFLVKEVNPEARTLKVELSQIPAIQGALVTVNAHNGEIVAMVGGYNFYTNKFNNATQAFRQTGSCFKPFVYTAAIEWGMTPDTIISGAPISKGSWQPHNYDGSLGNADVPMRIALAKSLNIPAVHAMETVGVQTVAQIVRRFGITVPMAPYLPSALGATEVPLIQMVSAYSVFPNKGVRAQQHLIRRVLDRDGNVLDEWQPTTSKVTSKYVALTMVDMMRGVVENGTAMEAKNVGVPLAGKTGTVNDHTDVWFIGYTPTYVTGVWMGYPSEKRNLGSDMTGGHGALPIFVEFMKDFLKNKPRENFEPPPPMPDDMKEMIRERKEELEQARAAQVAYNAKNKSDDANAPTITAPTLEQIYLPPPTGPTSSPTPPNGLNTTKPVEVKTPHAPVSGINEREPPPLNAARPRPTPINSEAPQKKKGKKGTDEPDGR
jgi:penicillin-binding protein 1A